jgi:acyl-coenzyme A thioesterase PaaI-like protein
MMKSAEKSRRQNATNSMYCSLRRRVFVDGELMAAYSPPCWTPLWELRSKRSCLPIRRTIDLKVTYLHPLSQASGVMRGTGRLINAGRRIAYIEGEIRDSNAALAVHAVGNFAIFTG